MDIKISKIVSGGQSGSDRAALDFGIKQNISIGGWCPKDGWAEDYPEAPGLLKDYPQLTPTAHDDISQRTYKNIEDSDATLIVFPEPVRSKGTDRTETIAIMLNKPVFVYKDENDLEKVKQWFKNLPENIVLNVAGPRESECPGVYNTTKELLNVLFEL